MDENLKSLFEIERSHFLDYVQHRISIVSCSSAYNVQDKMSLYGILVSLADVGFQKFDFFKSSTHAKV